MDCICLSFENALWVLSSALSVGIFHRINDKRISYMGLLGFRGGWGGPCWRPCSQLTMRLIMGWYSI